MGLSTPQLQMGERLINGPTDMLWLRGKPAALHIIITQPGLVHCAAIGSVRPKVLP